MQKKLSIDIFIFNVKILSYINGNIFSNVQFEIAPET